MADQRKDRPVLPPPPPQLAEQDQQGERAEQAQRAKQEAAEARREARAARAAERDRARADREREKQEAKERAERDTAAREAAEAADRETVQREQAERERHARLERASQEADHTREQPAVPAAAAAPRIRGGQQRRPAQQRRTRKAQLRLVQVDAWSVMKTAFLLSIALGIVLVVAVAIVWSVLGAAGVWDSINSIVQQAVGNATGPQFDITDYLSTSRVIGVTMVIAVLDVVLITAIATLGAFLYNLSAALLGGVEVTLAEDS